MEFTECCLCQSNDFEIIYRNLYDRQVNLKDSSFTLVRCRSCGLIYQNPRPTHDEMSIYYPENYESYEPIQKEKTSWLLQRAYDYGMAKRSRLITHHKKGGRLLDIGCAVGTFLNWMKHQGDWQLQGVEISSYASQIARSKYSLDVFNGTLEEAHFPDHSFDAISMWDVLEHLHNPVSSLQEINRILKHDGIIVLRVPNGSSLDAKIFKQYWKGLDIPRHLFIFNLKTLRRLLTETGFSILEWNTSSSSYLVFLHSLQFWLADKGIDHKIRSSLFKILFHPICRLISVPFFYPVGLLGYGSNLVISGRKT